MLLYIQNEPAMTQDPAITTARGRWSYFGQWYNYGQILFWYNKIFLKHHVLRIFVFIDRLPVYK